MSTDFIASRRVVLKSSIFGLLAVSLPNLVFATKDATGTTAGDNPVVPDRYPAIALEVASQVVGFAHFDLDKLRALVNPRPELAKATWDFGFGDWESAIAAASHVGRIDIVKYLLDKGATPTIFTFAVLGNFQLVKAIINSHPGIQRSSGPHGISLLQHAKTGMESGNGNEAQSQQLVDYLQKLGDAGGTVYPTLDEGEKQQYLGDYIYNSASNEGFSIKLNMRKMITLGRKGKNGGSLLKLGTDRFTYNGAPSVIVTFNREAGKVVSLTIEEPGFSVTVTKST